MTGVQLTDFSTQTQHCLKEIVPDSLDEDGLNLFFCNVLATLLFLLKYPLESTLGTIV